MKEQVFNGVLSEFYGDLMKSKKTVVQNMHHIRGIPWPYSASGEASSFWVMSDMGDSKITITSYMN